MCIYCISHFNPYGYAHAHTHTHHSLHNFYKEFSKIGSTIKSQVFIPRGYR